GKDAGRAHRLQTKRADCFGDARQGFVAAAQVLEGGCRLETKPLIHSPPSIASMRRFVAVPPWAEKPPILPPAATTRWHGTTIGSGLRPSAWPTARAAPAAPSRAAISP